RRLVKDRLYCGCYLELERLARCVPVGLAERDGNEVILDLRQFQHADVGFAQCRELAHLRDEAQRRMRGPEDVSSYAFLEDVLARPLWVALRAHARVVGTQAEAGGVFEHYGQ